MREVPESVEEAIELLERAVRASEGRSKCIFTKPERAAVKMLITKYRHVCGRLNLVLTAMKLELPHGA